MVAMQGEHDRSTADQIRTLFADLVAENDLVVVDVSEAEFVDSTFLHNLLIADKRAKEDGKVFRLQMGTAFIVRRAFEVSGILSRLDVVHNREDALTSSHERSTGQASRDV